MGLSEFIIPCILLMTIPKGVFCVLECSQCVSDPSGDCAKNPPQGTPCNSLEQQRGPVNCMVAKKKNASGAVVQFIRGCTVVGRSGGCLKQIDNATLCYNICTTDNCNSGQHHRSFSVYIFLLLAMTLILS